MSPGKEFDEVTVLRQKLAELEAELAHRKLREQTSDARLKMLVDAAPAMIWMSGSDALYTYFNRAWLDFRGSRLEDETGNGWTERLHPDDRDFCIETYLKSFSARQPFRMQYRMRRSNGDFCWVEDVGVPRYDDTGAFAGFMGSAADINDRKRGVFVPSEDSVKMVLALTERERQVLVLIANGKSTKEAAAQLGISYKTADSHRSRILEKLGVHETASMVRYAIRAGLIEP
ncbi:MAG TPA: LuxR C-terminal-related transcriptional regulator [Bryobacteraceae bacterium]